MEQPAAAAAAAAGLVPAVPRAEASASKDSAASCHPLQERKGLLSCVRLLDVSNFSSLGGPLPRAQDLPAEYFGTPSSAADEVISVSHAWRNQAHPDPTCRKMQLLGQLLSKITEGSGDAPGQQTRQSYLFLDFISIPQRPFCPSQQQRTEHEVDVFRRALNCMHEMYFHSDRIIHLPWEDAEVPGEGVEEAVPVAALQGVELAQRGECLQVAMQEGPSAGEEATGRAVQLFDQVVSLDGQNVNSLEEVETLLKQDAKTAKLRRFPFGSYSKIPADNRGWVFLERFITMVKCAMMDEETARQVVITPSRSIFEQIMRGARQLREASRQEARRQRPGELKRVLEAFREELRGKAFSPASTDKRELAEAGKSADDQEVVGRIMQHFVEHLAVHWEAEAAKQRSLASRLNAIVSAAETYLVEWDRFSEDYLAKLSAASTSNPWPVAVMIVVPLLIILLILLWPYADPDGHWTTHMQFWGIGGIVMPFTNYITFPIFVASATGIDLSSNRLLFFIAWAAGCTAVCIAIGVGVSGAWDIFPVPMLPMIGAWVAVAFVPILWCCVPREKQSSGEFRRRVRGSMDFMNVCVTFFGVAVPLLNASIPLVSEAWQAVLLSCYLLLKLLFEAYCQRLSRVLGADVMPLFVFGATYAYQANVCVAFSKVNSWFLVGEQVAFDALENAYHLYSLSRRASASSPSAAGSGAQEQYIVASLMVRELVELVAPASFLVIYGLARDFRPRSMTFFCDRTEEEVDRTMQYVSAHIAIEAVVTFMTCAFLISRNHRPLHLLRGVVSSRLLCLTLIAGNTLCYYLTMHHSHFGMDLSFKFQWLVEPEASWQCGLTWSAPVEGA